MAERYTRGETHGCIVCGRLHNLYVVYDGNGRFVDLKVMSADGRRVANDQRPLVACTRHSEDDVQRAVRRVYGESANTQDGS